MTDGDSHIVRPGSLFPLCGAEPNGNTTLGLWQLSDPDMLDGLEMCPECLLAAAREQRR